MQLHLVYVNLLNPDTEVTLCIMGIHSRAVRFDPNMPDEGRVLPEETEAFLPSGEDGLSSFLARGQGRRGFMSCLGLLTCINAILFPLSALCAASAFRWKHMVQHNHDSALLRMTSWYCECHNLKLKKQDFHESTPDFLVAPMFDQTQINIVDKKVNGSLLNRDNSIFRSPPSPEVDEAWDRIGSLKPHAISADDVIRLGKDPWTTAKYPEDWGFGPDAHMAELDTLHTIHCLNAIRRDVYWRHYFIDDYPDGVFPELHRVHTDHCIYIVLQNLMCSATPDFITLNWVQGQLTPFPDFNINKKCNDFDAILAWHEDTMLQDTEKLAQMRIPDGQEPLRMSDEFHRMFGSHPDGTGGHDHGH